MLIGSDGKVSEVYTDNTGKYSQKLRPITSYEIFVSIDGYEKLSIRETTEGVEIDKVFINDVKLNKEKKKLILPIVNFDFNKQDIRKENLQQLDDLAAALIDHSNVVLEVRGHTDDVGSIDQNNRLSKKRADFIKKYLMDRNLTNTIETKAYGEKSLLIETSDEVKEKRNRRAELYLQ